METKKVVGVAVILVAVVGVLVVFVGLPASSTQFHYERAYPADETRKVNILLDVRNTNVSVTFVDDPNLMYSVDVVQYSTGDHHHSYYQEWGDPHFSLDYHIDSLTDEGIKEVNVVLGTGTYYVIYIEGANNNASVVFDNGAVLAGQEILMSAAQGDFYFELTEDVSFTDAGLLVNSATGVNLVLDVDLPTGLNGRLEVQDGISFSPTSMVGWSLVSSGLGQPSVYTTSSTVEPLVNIEHNSLGSVNAFLRS